MELEMTPETRFMVLLVLVLMGPEFENTNQFDSFLPNFINQMTHDEMEHESLKSIHNYGQTEEKIKKIMNTGPPVTGGIVDFLREILIPTTEKVLQCVYILFYLKVK